MRPRKPRPEDNASAGSKLRDALARKQADDQTRARDDAARKEDAFRQSLSNWFNSIAAKLPQAVKDITSALDGGSAATDLSFSAEDSISIRGVTGANLETLPGFQALDAVCKELDIGHTVSVGRHGYGRKSTAGKEYLHVTVDVARPYDVTNEVAKPAESTKRPRRHGPRFR